MYSVVQSGQRRIIPRACDGRRNSLGLVSAGLACLRLATDPATTERRFVDFSGFRGFPLLDKPLSFFFSSPSPPSSASPLPSRLFLAVLSTSFSCGFKHPSPWLKRYGLLIVLPHPARLRWFLSCSCLHQITGLEKPEYMSILVYPTCIFGCLNATILAKMLVYLRLRIHHVVEVFDDHED